MAFANGITELYLPTAANAGSSQWGSDVRKLLDSADAGNDKTTKTDHGTGGNVTRTLDPYTTKTTDDTQANFGWAVTPSDMNSLAGAKRVIPAGDHVLTIRTASDQAAAAANSTYTMFVYRVGPTPTFTRTLLSSASGAAFNYGAVPDTYRTETVTVALSEIVFEEGETIQYSVEINSPGVVVVGRINTHDTGTQGGVAIRVTIPGLETIAEGAATITGSATVDGVTGKVLGTNGTVTGSATVTATAGWISSGVASITSDATVTGVMSSIYASAATITGSAAVDGQMSKVLGTDFTIDTGGSGGGNTYPRSRVVNS